ncbi:MAG: aldo/keto reductase [Eubacterium sp.]|nr:aldo/keto reductase [Eubacterium sp.]
MNYRTDKYGNKISALGYGCLRLTKKANVIDLDKAEKELLRGLELGINYYDTAYLYQGNEVALGKIVARNNIRQKINIATKLPQYYVKSSSAIDKYFNEELARLQTDYIDYYLMHMLTDYSNWENLVRLGIEDWIKKKKECGAIRNIGFSFHGNTDMFLKILNAYDWDFCQIQYNYMDIYSQAGVKGLKAAAKKGIPVIIMEPLRGGKLVNMLPTAAKKAMKDSGRNWSPAEWGLRWLWNQPEVTCVLSGMNSMEMVDENCRIASDAQVGHFTEADFDTIEKVRSSINETVKVGCTGCRYCMPCPKGVDIPGIFRAYNTMYTENKFAGFREYAQTVALTKEPTFASQCVKCGKCESQCPQGIAIRDMLVEADKHLRPLPFKVGLNLARKIIVKG